MAPIQPARRRRTRPVRLSDRLSAMTMHASARFTVRYGDDLRFAGRDLPRPRRRRDDTRHGRVTSYEHGDARRPGPGALPRRRLADALPADGRLVVPLRRRDRRRAGGQRRLPHRPLRRLPGRPAPVPRRRGRGRRRARWHAGRGRRLLQRRRAGRRRSRLQARDLGSFIPRLQVLGVPALDLASDLPGRRRDDLAVAARAGAPRLLPRPGDPHRALRLPGAGARPHRPAAGDRADRRARHPAPRRRPLRRAAARGRRRGRPRRHPARRPLLPHRGPARAPGRRWRWSPSTCARGCSTPSG